MTKKSLVYGIFAFVLLCARPSWALSGLYFGGNFGLDSYLSNSFDAPSPGLGYGGELGLRVSDTFEIMAAVGAGSHGTSSGNPLRISYPMLSLQFHPFPLDEMNFSFGAGVGYFNHTENGVTDQKWGVTVGTIMDYAIDKTFLLGVEGRVNRLFGPTVGGSFYTFLVRVGCVLDLEGDRIERTYIQ